MPPPATPPAAATSTRRIAALDGLRGLAVLLVVLGHAGDQLWPRAPIAQIPVVRGFFGGGAVVVFFVVGGFIVTRGLLRERAEGTLDPVRFYARRLVRLGVQLVPLAAVIALVAALDPTDTTAPGATYGSLLGVLTHTFNAYAADHLLATRPDLGHLWYLSVQQQAYLVLPLVLVVLGGRTRWARWALVGVGVAVVAAATAWRLHLLDTSGWVVASISTAARVDGLVVGVLVAVGAPWAARRLPTPVGRLVLAAGAAGLLVLLALLPELPPYAYLGAWGVIFMLVVGALVLAIATTSGSPVMGALAHPVPSWLGRASLAIFVWHLPVILFVARHTPGWGWPARTVLGVVAVALVSWAAHRFFDEPARRWLATHLRPPVAPRTATGAGTAAAARAQAPTAPAEVAG